MVTSPSRQNIPGTQNGRRNATGDQVRLPFGPRRQIGLHDRRRLRNAQIDKMTQRSVPGSGHSRTQRGQVDIPEGSSLGRPRMGYAH